MATIDLLDANQWINASASTMYTGSSSSPTVQFTTPTYSVQDLDYGRWAEELKKKTDLSVSIDQEERIVALEEKITELLEVVELLKGQVDKASTYIEAQIEDKKKKDDMDALNLATWVSNSAGVGGGAPLQQWSPLQQQSLAGQAQAQAAFSNAFKPGQVIPIPRRFFWRRYTKWLEVLKP